MCKCVGARIMPACVSTRPPCFILWVEMLGACISSVIQRARPWLGAIAMPTLRGLFFNQSQWCIEWTGFGCSQITEIVFLMLPSGPLTPSSPILAWLSAEVPSCHSVYLRQDGYLAHTNRTEGTAAESSECGAPWMFAECDIKHLVFVVFSRLHVW